MIVDHPPASAATTTPTIPRNTASTTDKHVHKIILYVHGYVHVYSTTVCVYVTTLHAPWSSEVASSSVHHRRKTRSETTCVCEQDKVRHH